jgi:CheY-like chemotaxis protein
MCANEVVLLADDNVDAVESLGLLIEYEGFAVHIAHNGLDAIALAGAIRPTIAVLDITMPGATGYEVATWIRKQDWGHSTRIIALTAYSGRDRVSRSFASGFDVHLTKPAGADQILEAFV